MADAIWLTDLQDLISDAIRKYTWVIEVLGYNAIDYLEPLVGEVLPLIMDIFFVSPGVKTLFQ